jgi:Carboxypeptidase regulatory-like domain
MRWHAPLLLPLLLTASVAAQEPPTTTARPETIQQMCTVSGVVVRNVDGTPLKGATVLMVSDESRQNAITASTGADGHFELRNIPAGHYQLSVRHVGYVAMQYGQKRTGDPGSTLTLRPGQKLAELIFKLGKTAVVTGHVFDEDGEPMLGIRVSALREAFDQGKIHFETINADCESNDLGEFRLYELNPGRYLVRATPERWSNRGFIGTDKNLEGYARIYYPGVASSGKATVITVKSDDEISSIDMHLKKVAVYKIRGKIVDPSSKVKGGRAFQVSALRRGEETDWDTQDMATISAADGSFEIAGAPSANYTVTVGFLSRSDGSSHGARQDVNVTNADVEGLELSVGQYENISGRVIWDGAPKQEGPPLIVDAESMEDPPVPHAGGQVDDKSQFVLKGVPEGEFRVKLFGVSKDCYIKELRYDEHVLPDTRIRVGKDSVGRLEITLSSRGAHIKGVVVNENNLPAFNAWVVAIPEKKVERASYFTDTDQYGQFDIPGLPPGSYRLFSWAGIDRGVWEDPEFLKAYLEKSTSIEVEEGDKKTEQLNLIPLRAEDGGRD